MYYKLSLEPVHNSNSASTSYQLYHFEQLCNHQSFSHLICKRGIITAILQHYDKF